MEADYNLLLKWFMAKHMMYHAEVHQSIADEQNGGRKGCQACDGAVKKTVSMEIMQLD